MNRLGKDSSEPCRNCGQAVRVSQVVTWAERDRLYWFLTGLCRDCG